jgi:uncharacterized protein (TIGR03067 family)
MRQQMNTPRLAVAVLSFLAMPTVHAQTAAPSTQVEEHTKPLQGNWKGEEIGRETAGEWTIAIAGNTIRIEGPGRVEWYVGTFTVADDQHPKQLQATITDCPRAEFIGKPAMSIFKIENGTLTIAGNHPGHLDAPRDFDGGGNSRRFIFKKEPGGE